MGHKFDWSVWTGGASARLDLDHLWVNIVFIPRGVNPRGKCDGQMGLKFGWSVWTGGACARLGLDHLWVNIVFI